MEQFREIGTDVVIYGSAKILTPQTTIIGSHVIIDDLVFIGAHKKLVIGNYIHIASHASITGGGICVLSDFSTVCSGVRILTGSDSFVGDALVGSTVPLKFRNVNRAATVVGCHAVIGANSVVLPGVVIGEGAAVGAGSIVTRDLEPWGIYVGQPARRTRDRPRDVIQNLMKQLFLECGHPVRRFENASDMLND